MLKDLLPKDWKQQLKPEINSDYFNELDDFIQAEYKEDVVYPAKKNIFKALQSTSYKNVNAVLLGQDPYHGEGQANGLCFSVNQGIKFPPSLCNIFKELNSDLGIDIPWSGDLKAWAEQGVLMLNAILTVRKSEAGSHRNKGWESFTDSIIKDISDNRQGVVFILWGNYARQKSELIDTKKHHIIESPHPSPFSARTGFFGSKPFSKTNEILEKTGNGGIDWSLG